MKSLGGQFSFPNNGKLAFKTPIIRRQEAVASLWRDDSNAGNCNMPVQNDIAASSGRVCINSVAQRGTPLQVLKELGGWETLEMVQRYAHLSADHLAHWVRPLTAEPAPMLAAI